MQHVYLVYQNVNYEKTVAGVYDNEEDAVRLARRIGKYVAWVERYDMNSSKSLRLTVDLS